MVMLFHSPMSRMNRTLPDVVDGDSEPKTASWRIHHGPMTRRNTATDADGRRERDGRAPGAGRAPRPPAIEQEDDAQRDEDEQAVVPGERREAGEQAGQDERAPGMRRPTKGTGRHPQRGDDQRLVEREVVGLRHVDGGQQRDRHEHARPDRHERSGARVPGDGPGQRRGDRADERERERRCPGDVTEDRQERDLDDRRQRHPVGVGRDRQGRDGRDLAADLGEDPDEVDVEPLAGVEGTRDVHVVRGIGVCRVREMPDEQRPDEEGEPIQQQRGTHGRCRVAPGPDRADRYEWPTPARPA